MAKSPMALGPDGISRPLDEQQRINSHIVACLGGAAGQETMKYLRSISIERVCGPHASDQELRHLEGMRYIVGILSQRINMGHQEKTNAGRKRTVPEQPAR